MPNITDLWGYDQRTDWAAGLNLTIAVESINPEGLGVCVAELGSQQQAAFLGGLWETMAGFDGGYGTQAAYIAEGFAATPARGLAVADLLRAVADQIETRCAR